MEDLPEWLMRLGLAQPCTALHSFAAWATSTAAKNAGSGCWPLVLSRGRVKSTRPER